MQKINKRFIFVHDYLITYGGAEVVLTRLIKIFQIKKLYTTILQNDIGDKFRDLTNIHVFSGNANKFLVGILKLKFGRLITPLMNIWFNRKLRALQNKSTKTVFLSTSWFIPLIRHKMVVYYHRFPTWFLANYGTFLKKMPFFLKWLYSLIGNFYQQRFFEGFQNKSIDIVANSTYTAYWFYKYWQKHAYVFFPTFLFDDKKFNIRQILKQKQQALNIVFDTKVAGKNKSAKHNLHKEINLIYAGRVDYGKGLGCLLDVLHNTLQYTKCNQAIKRIRFHIMGNGPLLQDFKALQKYIPQIKIYGWVQHKEVLRKMLGMDYLFNIAYESFGLTMFEASLHGVKILTTPISGVYDFAVINQGIVPFYNINKNVCIKDLQSFLCSKALTKGFNHFNHQDNQIHRIKKENQAKESHVKNNKQLEFDMAYKQIIKNAFNILNTYNMQNFHKFLLHLDNMLNL